MSQSTKSEFYRYSLKSSAYVTESMCSARIYAYPVPPENAETLEGIWTHFRIKFKSGIAVDDRVVEAIGIANDRPLFYQLEPQASRMIQLNQAADGDRVVDIKIDLTSLIIDKTKVAYQSLFESDYTLGDKTFIYIKLPIALADTLDVGDIEIWKIDTLWTTREIR